MSFEVPSSPGIAVSRVTANIETSNLGHETISPDLYFCGITKLEDVQSSDILRGIGLPPQLVPAYLGEVRQLLQFLNNAGIDPRQVRHALRQRIGDGGHQRNQREPISLSDTVRAAFDRAGNIAAENNAQIVMVHHLLAALLEISDTHLHALLVEIGIDVEKLRETAAALPIPAPVHPSNGKSILTELGTDLTEKARAGKLAPVIGRKREMLQVIKILGRDKKNCPVLIGAAGVGKTAIVEGLAQRIAVQNIHPDFHHKRIVQINASSLVSGTKYRGDFEERMEQLLAEVRTDPDLILFVDELHLLIGAGAAGGSMDAANILKPALASGDVKLIGATTDAEYRQYIEKDAALERRFEPVRVEEPLEQETVEMLVGVRQRLQEKHQVSIGDDAILAAVQLSVRYIPDRRLPDKAYTLLDDACTWVRYGSNISFNPAGSTAELTFNLVTAAIVREVLADRLDIPVNELDEDERQRIRHMADILRERVVGQDAAIQTITQAVQRRYAGLQDDNRPVGVFLFTGPSGVGKTELAKATAAFLFGSEARLIRLDMSEYTEKHAVSRLVGSPPGYVGYEEGGQLTNALRETPYAVVLIDEIEKAHPEVVNIFLQLFDDGRLTDAQGRTVDGSHALFVITSNLGYDTLNNTSTPTPADVKQAVYAHFRPELINRLDEIVYFQPLQPQHIAGIVQVQVNALAKTLAQQQIGLDVNLEAQKWLANKGYDAQLGARPLKRLIDRELKNAIGGLILEGKAKPTDVIFVTVVDGELYLEARGNETIHPEE